MVLEVFRSKRNELLADLLLTGHYGFLLPGIVYIISESVIISGKQVSYYFFSIRIVRLIHQTGDLSVDGGKDVYDLFGDTIELCVLNE